MGQSATIVNEMNPPPGELELNPLDEARCELREGIESSREIVRQSRMLIELSETAGAGPPPTPNSKAPAD
jgi:hypothetical protein